jgi:ATP-dependent DNA helicase RecG
MVIEHPERFGLAQLHQLRGRVGRGCKKGTCLLIESKNLSTTARLRIETLAKTYDGFEIAQKDLELRGHGELIGMRQAGLGELDLSEIIREPDLLLSAKRAAQHLLASDPGLLKPQHGLLKNLVESVLDRTLDL